MIYCHNIIACFNNSFCWFMLLSIRSGNLLCIKNHHSVRFHINTNRHSSDKHRIIIHRFYSRICRNRFLSTNHLILQNTHSRKEEGEE